MPPMPSSDLLADALLEAAAVEAVGDEPVLVVVLLDVGVEQVQRDASDLRPATGGRSTGAPAMLDADARRRAPAHGHRPRVEAGEALLLPAAAVELLAEVAVAVEEADAGERAGRGRWPP